jgi:BirA family biotin operon repressor/biotin-[acetyl-CoA-carboxylase] ligase
MLTIEGDVDPAGRLAAEQLIQRGRCRAVCYFARLPSTNSMAMAELSRGVLALHDCPKLYLADQQTAGRGRHGRSWISTDGSLTFSLVVDRPSPAARASKLISLAAGLGVARSLEFEFAPLRTQLKWPNDVHIDGGKVAGLLLEATAAAPHQVVIGIGLNVSDAPDLGEAHAARPVRSVAAVVGRHVARYTLLPLVVEHVLEAIAQADQSAGSLLSEYRSRCLLSGKLVSFQDGPHRSEGRCQGISGDGQLIVETAGGTRCLDCGEAELVRPRSGSLSPRKGDSLS